jgi:methionine aminopeptidase
MYDFTQMIDNLKKDPKSIVFTEGSDPRILEATARLCKDDFLKPVLVGAKAEVESVAKENGYGVFEVLTGHGVGADMHEDPYIPNYSNHESEGIILKSGMTLAIEPMFSLGTKEVWLLPDEWGIVTQDGSKAAHFEHTVLVTKDGYEILTGE